MLTRQGASTTLGLPLRRPMPRPITSSTRIFIWRREWLKTTTFSCRCWKRSQPMSILRAQPPAPVGSKPPASLKPRLKPPRATAIRSLPHTMAFWEEPMTTLIVLAALAFLIIGAYRGYSVVICAPLAALFAVALTNPTSIAPAFSGLFMEQMVGFIKLYFPVFFAWCSIRQGDRVVRFCRIDCCPGDQIPGKTKDDRCNGYCLRDPHIWWRFYLRGGIRRLSVRSRTLSSEQYSKTADASRHCARCIYLQHRLAPRHAADPQHHPDIVLRYDKLGCPGARSCRNLLHLPRGRLVS
ncbi:hypothetical protein AGR7A_pAt20210 [Agrobacterium deltaense NCPPB 1641]|uniref:Uncharacterized protein n=1 Tax=Agrobacterium deltaense NCPPB 1641 TaxID=1183425 RepID=A0A1S7U8X2_9HYPH|nr:hypothetical protein AGR7A_pAt20210 [Agrobacterium deltaense NCPPB 1641]